MKNALYITLFILILGNFSHFGLPWWALAPIAALASWLFPLSPGKSFLAAFVGGLLLWYFNAFLLNSANDGMLSAKVGQLFQGLKGWHQSLVVELRVGEGLQADPRKARGLTSVRNVADDVRRQPCESGKAVQMTPAGAYKKASGPS